MNNVGLKLLLCLMHFLGIGSCVLSVIYGNKFKGGFSWKEAKLQFNWHPVLMTFGFLYLFANALLSYRTFVNFNRVQVKYLHLFLNVVCCITITIALVAVFDSHNFAVPKKANLYTFHSWIGLFTVILFLIQGLTGFIIFIYPTISLTNRISIATPNHIVFGTIIFTMAILSAVSGVCEKAIFSLSKSYKNLPAEALILNLLGLVYILFGITVMYILLKTSFRRQELVDNYQYPIYEMSSKNTLTSSVI